MLQKPVTSSQPATPAKFRAWDGMRMTTSGIMYNSTTGAMETAAGMPLMQWIGLSDSEGQEVYQDDILDIEGIGNCVVRPMRMRTAWAFFNGEDVLSYPDIVNRRVVVVSNKYEATRAGNWPEILGNGPSNTPNEPDSELSL